MKKILFLLPLLALALAACDNEKAASLPPVWKGFTYSPSPARPGDSVVVTAVQAKKGKYLNACDYTFSLRIQVQENGTTRDTTLTHSYHTNYDGTDNGNPSWKFLLPAATVSSSASCTFKARWSNSADGTPVSYASTGGDGTTGNITSYGYTLYSEANGSFTLRIAQ